MQRRYTLLAAALIVGSSAAATPEARLEPYVQALRHGSAPVSFVRQQLAKHDLIILDDALHTASEPWKFYAALLRDPAIAGQLHYVFLEIGPVNYQPVLDAYLNSPVNDSTLLLPLQQNANDYGWANASYREFLSAVWQVNQSLPKERRIQVVATDLPAYWPMIRTREDYDTTMTGADARDYFIYKVILARMDDFKSGKKALFLTNSRHAYKGIRRGNGELYWNTGTWLHQLHPGKSYAVRMHNLNLEISRGHVGQAKTREGLDNMKFRWVRMERGLWDSAFAANGAQAVAVDLNHSVLGKAPYIGNHMMDAKPGQTMADAFDAVIFLAPLEQLHRTGSADIYDAAFRKELARRLGIMSSKEEIGQMLAQDHAGDLDEYVRKNFGPSAETPEPALAGAGPADEWKRGP